MTLTADLQIDVPDTAYVNVVATAPLTAAFSVPNIQGGTAPYTVAWDFGDGTTGTGNPVTHTYDNIGIYAAKAIITDSSSPVQSLTKDCPVSVQGVTPPPLTVTATAVPTSGIAPLTVQFAAVASGGVSPYAYAWTFGDGTTGTGPNPSHTYNSAGTYAVGVTVTDSTGATASFPLSVTATPPTTALECPAPAIKPNPGTVGQPSSFAVAPTGGVPPYTYKWHIYVSGIKNPGDVGSFTGTPSGRGTWNVSCTVTDTKGTSVQSPSTQYTVFP